MLSVAIFLLAFAVAFYVVPHVWRGTLSLIALLAVAIPASAGAFDTFITAATPGLLELMSVAITALIGWAVAKASKKWGIEIEAKHRESLHWALYTAAQLALERKLTGQAAIELIRDYVRRSVPDAIGVLKPSSTVLEDLARAKLVQVIGEQNRTAAGSSAG